jgi:predicted permease
MVVSLALGYLSRRLGLLHDEHARRITATSVSYLLPIAVIFAFWSLRPQGWETLALPAISILLPLLLLPVAALAGRFWFREPESFSPWVICSMFSNQGFTYGAFLCYVLLDTQGVALATLWTIPFTPMIYLVGFYLASRWSQAEASPWQRLRYEFSQPYGRNPLIGIGLGLVLFGLRYVPESFPLADSLRAGPPEWSRWFVDLAVPTLTMMQLYAIGVTLRLSQVRSYWRVVVAQHGMKYLVQPALGLLLALLFGLFAPDKAELRQVVLIECLTPVAIMSLIIAQIMRLNLGLANSLWITTNLFSIAAAPGVLLLAQLIA